MGNSCIKVVFIKRYLSNEKSGRPLLTNKEHNVNHLSTTCEALCEYSSNESDQLSYQKGDRIEILLKQSDTLWHGRNLRTREEGYFSKEDVEIHEIKLDIIAEDDFTDNQKDDVYEALCDVTNDDENEQLSYLKGDRIRILEKQDTKWHGRNLRTNEEGYVRPENMELYDELKEYPWYRGGMKRMRAEQLLLRMGTPGTFMIRLSETNPADYSLSLRDDDSIKHYRIKRHERGGFYIKNKCNFADLKVLVDHYRRSADGLARKLDNACPIPISDSDDRPHSCADQWETTRERIKLLKCLGEGHFSEVYEGLWNETIKVAVKKLKTADNNGTASELDREAFLAEATIMKKLSHPKLVRLYAVCSIGEPVYIIMELMAKGNLRKHLLSKEGKNLSVPELVDISAQIADGMSFLESNNFIHRDLAARNILVTDKNTAKVADFGLSKILDSTDATTDYVIENENFKMAPKWAAPEVKTERKFSVKSDVWSFGVVMYEIGSRGHVPDDVSVVQNERPEKFPEQLYNTMVKCWNLEPCLRPTFTHLKFELTSAS